jgi:hypothetical protein
MARRPALRFVVRFSRNVATARATRAIIALLLATLAVIGGLKRAYAAFAPIDCTSSVRNNINYTSGDIQQLDWKNPNACVSGTWGNCPHYPNGNRTDWRREFVANQYVSQLDFHFTAVSVESGYDYVYGGRWDSSVPDFQDTHSSTGAPLVPFTWSVSAAGSNSFMSHPGRVRLYADQSITGTGFSVDYIDAASCSANNTTLTRNLGIGERTTGLLLGTDDVVYMKFVMPPDGHGSVALWGDPNNASNTDIDLYMRCGALPTQSTYDFRSYRPGTSEFLHFTTTDCSSGNTWYVAAHAYNGKGVFNIMPSGHYSARHYDLHVGMAADSGTAVASSFNTYWRNAARGIYGATKGAEFIEYIYNHTTKEPSTSDGRCGNPLTPCASMIDLDNTGGQSRSTANGATTLQCSNSRTKCVAYLGQQASVQDAHHEWGHVWFRLPDEYSGIPVKGQCGCSKMGKTTHLHNFCMSTNHTYDPDPGAASYTGVNMWNIMNFTSGISYRAPATTPDAYDFVDFDFDDVIGTVTNPN